MDSMETHKMQRKTAAAALVVLVGTLAFAGAMPQPASAAPAPGRFAGFPAAPTIATAPALPIHPNLHLMGAMHAAGSVLGHPYRWGGSSPGGFDCSGLVAWSFAHVGKSMPRGSAAQRGATMPLAPHEAVAGDLVFFGSPTYHVGIYMGDGRMIHAPRAGKTVEFASVHNMGTAPYFGRVK